MPESAFARTAAQALFVYSNLEQARSLTIQALRHSPNDAEALFVRMEVAAMEDDEATVLDAAIRLCEAGEATPADPRVQLAAIRIRDAAANIPAFRAVITRIKALLANSQEQWPALHEALLRAAMDGVPGLDPYAVSRSAGILTEWRIVRLVGGRLIAGTEDGISSLGDLSAAIYQNRVVENFQFPDGWIVLPDYLSHHGKFYGAAHFASLTAAVWRMDVEGSGRTEVYVDGRRLPGIGGLQGNRASTFEASPGPHRVVIEFTAAAAPLRVAITPANDEVRPALPSKASLQELTYLLAARHYARGDFDSAVKQVEAVPSAENSAALQFLLVQAEIQAHRNRSDVVAAWKKLHALPSAALAANDALAQDALEQGDTRAAFRLATEVAAARPSDSVALEILTSASQANRNLERNEDDLWLRRIAAHPSCRALREAASFYRQQGELVEASSAQRQLDGCAPESLDYARSLAGQGSHAEAAQALQRLVSAAPLNREARLMLVRELQLAGEDEAAQCAAVEWLHVAPNAGAYHRLAAAVEPVGIPVPQGNATVPFYAAYRRDVSEIVRESEWQGADATAALLMEDHVAIARADGSVSLYVHTLTRQPVGSAQPAGNATVPQEAQVLTLRIVHADGASAPMSELAQHSAGLVPGDAIEEEYVINYAGDGGIAEHCEAFQFVFRNVGHQPLRARFVVLTPAEQADRGVVIATGGTPEMEATVRGGMLQRAWDSDRSQANAAGPEQANAGSPIVRVVEEEHGWSTPSSAEHQRRIETIHPGPRPEES